eukprot:scaffold34024_cov27-Tisochrysis_lutea.AAC.1
MQKSRLRCTAVFATARSGSRPFVRLACRRGLGGRPLRSATAALGSRAGPVRAHCARAPPECLRVRAAPVVWRECWWRRRARRPELVSGRGVRPRRRRHEAGGCPPVRRECLVARPSRWRRSPMGRSRGDAERCCCRLLIELTCEVERCGAAARAHALAKSDHPSRGLPPLRSTAVS